MITSAFALDYTSRELFYRITDFANSTACGGVVHLLVKIMIV